MTDGGQADPVEVFIRKFWLPIGLVVVAFLGFVLGMATGTDALTGLGVISGMVAVVVVLKMSQSPKPPVVVSTVPVADQVRQQRLQEVLSTDIARLQGRIESVTPYSAVVVSGQRVNHVLHLLISVLLCGLWLPVWFIIAASAGEKRHVITVDPCGNVNRN